jgi:hypothetical protein
VIAGECHKVVEEARLMNARKESSSLHMTYVVVVNGHYTYQSVFVESPVASVVAEWKDEDAFPNADNNLLTHCLLPHPDTWPCLDHGASQDVRKSTHESCDQKHLGLEVGILLMDSGMDMVHFAFHKLFPALIAFPPDHVHIPELGRVQKVHRLMDVGEQLQVPQLLLQQGSGLDLQHCSQGNWADLMGLLVVVVGLHQVGQDLEMYTWDEVVGDLVDGILLVGSLSDFEKKDLEGGALRDMLLGVMDYGVSLLKDY